MKIGNKEFDLKERTYVMGILNITPDSFSDGGKFNELGKALKRVQEMIEEGADIIDIGGESTRPGFEVVEAEEEINRVVPVIKAIKEKFDIPISIDTYKSETAKAAIEAGADIINDIWGFKKDKDMAKLCAEKNVPCILMHNRDNAEYTDIMKDIKEDLIESINIAIDAGVKRENIILDPGIGFAKSLEENLKVMNNIEKIKELGFPILLGTSRKSMIGLTLNLPKDERLEGTLATTVLGITKGCEFIRVHDIKENKRVCVMTDSILKSK
ncbi:dihydropteroate synthase [Clostridium thermobutyricum]|uniref:Dihydropteroate synthase n=1 Tax=Clostridium thermobutyricum TaxID=29372 RepID=N9Y6E0_9CLOT|nr:dihydropteroate synthase [Clostridium thermobutyricum]ENZ03367.1 dihydropteroate synthase [Clostridium thermobutyricum]